LPYVKLEGFMVGVSVLVVFGVGMYVFYAFFSGRMASIPALVLFLVAAVGFGFFVVAPEVAVGRCKDKPTTVGRHRGRTMD